MVDKKKSASGFSDAEMLDVVDRELSALADFLKKFHNHIARGDIDRLLVSPASFLNRIGRGVRDPIKDLRDAVRAHRASTDEEQPKAAQPSLPLGE